MDNKFHSPPMIIQSRYQRGKYFVIVQLSSKRNGRIPPYARLSKDTDYSTCAVICDLVQYGLSAEIRSILQYVSG